MNTAKSLFELDTIRLRLCLPRWKRWLMYTLETVVEKLEAH
jgi:hypothetical protein